MTKHSIVKFQITGPARRDIAAIAKWSLREFGEAAATRYRALIRQALLDIKADPDRPGSDKRLDLMIEDARTYHLAFSRGRAGHPGVKEPRHFLLYRRRGDVIEVARIIHDAPRSGAAPSTRVSTF